MHSTSPTGHRRPRTPRFLVRALSAALLVGGLGIATASPAAADLPPSDKDQVCGSYLPNGTDKIDTTGDPETVTVHAPEGKLIDGYCVKTGSIQQGSGPVFITVDPPQTTVVVSSPGRDSVSHYSVRYVNAETPPTPVVNLVFTFIQECPQEGDPSDWLATWRVRNPNADPVDYTVDRAGTGQIREATAEPGDSFFTTPWGAQTLILRWQDENGAATSDTKAGGDTAVSIDTDKCRPEQPDAEVETVVVDGTFECDATTVTTTTTTTTTPYIWTGTEWVLDTDPDKIEVVVTEGTRDLTAVEQQACPTTQEPTLSITALSPVCQDDVPYILYDASVDGVEFTTATLTFRDRNGAFVESRTVDSLRGRTIYPGAEVDDDGNGINWPGWKFENGFWVEDPSDTILRDGLTVTIEVNPSATANVAYPDATEDCAGPKLVESVALTPVAPGPMTPPAPQTRAPAPETAPAPAPETAPETATETAPPAPAADPTQVTLPATGSTSGILATVAGLLMLAGFGLRRFGPQRINQLG